MLHVKTALAPSAISGIGLFAAEPITPSTIIWSFAPGLDREFSPETVRRWPQCEQVRLWSHMYLSRLSGTYILAMDDSRYINHSGVPNAPDIAIPGSRYFVTVAARLICPGEEITSDYAIIDREFPRYRDELRESRLVPYEIRCTGGRFPLLAVRRTRSSNPPSLEGNRGRGGEHPVAREGPCRSCLSCCKAALRRP